MGVLSIAVYCRSIHKPFYIVTASDERFFPALLNCIGSLHKVDFDNIGEIAVFDLGFTVHQKQILKTIQKVKIYSIKMTSPFLLTNFKIDLNGKIARGLYAWKPVVIKQALDMFPYILYMDAGICALTSLDKVFDYIHKKNYFFIGLCHSIAWMTPKHVIDKFDLLSEERKWILDNDVVGISAGFQGITRKYYDTYVMPMYELTKDLRNFVDDGTTPEGFGTARYDQTLFSIYVRLLGLDVLNYWGVNYFDLNGKIYSFSVGTDIEIYRLGSAPDFTPDIKYNDAELNNGLLAH